MVAELLWAALWLKRLSFARHAKLAMTGLYPQTDIFGVENIPSRGPCLVTCNHYSRPGFAAWWLALGISAVVADQRAADVDRDIKWVMTAAWTFPNNRLFHYVLTPLTYWAFRRLAMVYDFVTMPPMPPSPDEMVRRAAAVLRTIRLARRASHQNGMIGLAPEGMDTNQGLGKPPPGVGLFIARLVEAGLPILPVGVSERDGRLCLSFGTVFVPEIPTLRDECDAYVTEQVMAALRKEIL